MFLPAQSKLYLPTGRCGVTGTTAGRGPATCIFIEFEGWTVGWWFSRGWLWAGFSRSGWRFNAWGSVVLCCLRFMARLGLSSGTCRWTKYLLSTIGSSIAAFIRYSDLLTVLWRPCPLLTVSFPSQRAPLFSNSQASWSISILIFPLSLTFLSFLPINRFGLRKCIIFLFDSLIDC